MASNGIFDLDKNLVTSGFLDGNGSLSIGITNHTNPTAVNKITTNAPLGADAFVVDSVEATAGAQASGVTFLSGSGTVGFQASGDLFAELAVFPDPTSSDFASALGPVADTKFGLPLDTNLSVVMLRWGADAKASGNGSIALGAGVGSIDFSAGSTGSLFFSVLQQVPRTTPTDDALAGVVKSWKLPVHVHSADDLAPRTHLLSEVGGSLTASIGATFGHEFNWIRQVSIPGVDGATGLAGDIGLKLQLGLTASFDLTMQGRYAVVVSREADEPVIRVRIYKLKLNGFDFGLSASAAATLSVPLPDDFDDLITAVLGTHALQILNELEDPNTINTWISKYGTEYVGDLFQKFTGLSLTSAIAKITDFANRWSALPSSVASLFEKLAEKEIPDLSDIEAVAKLIATPDADGLKTLLEGKIDDLKLPFFASPLGQYLEALAEGGALTLLQGIPPSIQQGAQKTLDFLDGDDVEKVLNQIVTEVDSRLGLNAILADLQGDPATVLDKLLFSKLEAFLGRTPVLQDIQKLQTTIKTLQGKVGTLYAKTVAALKNTYTAQFNATFQQTTTDTALVDASFDFSDAGSAPGVAQALQQLLRGRLDDFLTHPLAGVTLASGALTHDVKRHSHVDLTLPFVKVEGDWISDATTSFNAIDENGGRLSTYQLNATGDAERKTTFTSLWKGRNWRSSTIALTAQISSKLPSGGSAGSVRVFAKTVAEQNRMATSRSSIRMEVANMSLKDLDIGIRPFATQFLRRAFADNSAFDKWATTGGLLSSPANTLVSLDVELPGAVPLAWLSNTSTNKGDPIYKSLSLTLQFLLKRYLRDYYFRDVDRYKTLATAYLVLLYAAIPPENSVKVNGAQSSDGGGVYWDTTDINAVKGMANLAKQSKLPQGFAGQLQAARTRLLTAGQTDLAKFYDPSNGLDGFFNQAMTDTNVNLLKNSLLALERGVILDACTAALSAASFNALVAANKPVEALNALADFGNTIAQAFNQDLSSIFVEDNDALQRLSPLIFAQAASVFDSTISATNYDSTLSVVELKLGAAMPDNFPDFTAADSDILLTLNAASFGL